MRGSRVLGVVCLRGLATASLLGFVAPAAVSAAGFPIATMAQAEYSAAVAFDGTNFLVSIQESVSPLPGSTLGAKLVSPSGAVLATIIVQRTGDAPDIAFAGTNYLLAWADHTTSGGDAPVFGQLVSKQATAVGGPFQLSQSVTVVQVEGIAFDGANYLVIWTDRRRVVAPPSIPQPGDKDIYGRFVSPAGVPVGNEFKISDGAGKEASVAFGASRYLVVWNEDFADTETRGRFVTPAGALQTPFTVNGSSAPSDNACRVAFDGTNFLVAWSDDVGGSQSAEWDTFAQLVSPAAALVGSPIPITTAPGAQLGPYIAFDGVNYLVTWTDIANDANGDFVCDPGEGTCADVYGQFVSPLGARVGTTFAVAVGAENQSQSPVAYGAGKYLVAWTHRFKAPDADVYGGFVGSRRSAGDLNGNGSTDIVWRNVGPGDPSNGALFLWLMAGTNAIGTYLDPISTDWVVQKVADFNGDGKADILWRNLNPSVADAGKLYLWLMNGPTVIAGTGYTDNQADLTWQVQAVGDLNGDGNADIVWRNVGPGPGTGALFLWLMNGPNLIGYAYLDPIDTDWQIQRVGDFNGDGSADILWRNLKATGPDSGKLYLWLMNGSTVIAGTGYTNSQADFTWQVQATGDLNGDGRQDIIWRNVGTGPGRGALYVWLMNGAQIAASTYLDPIATDWQIQGTGDFNGDGWSDILWRNTNAAAPDAGKLYVWMMNGAAVTAGTGFTSDQANFTWDVKSPR